MTDPQHSPAEHMKLPIFFSRRQRNIVAPEPIQVVSRGRTRNSIIRSIEAPQLKRLTYRERFNRLTAVPVRRRFTIPQKVAGIVARRERRAEEKAAVQESVGKIVRQGQTRPRGGIPQDVVGFGRRGTLEEAQVAFNERESQSPFRGKIKVAFRP